MNLASISLIDFYVSVIDNYGDMGFAINLAFSLHHKYRNIRIRFFSDDYALFQKFLPVYTPEWIQYRALDTLSSPVPPAPAPLIFSFFDYRVPKEYLSLFSHQKTIVVFSYLLLHKGMESLHRTTYVLESGFDTVIHFVPSIVPGGGGIVINPVIENKKKEFLVSGKSEGRRVFMGNTHPDVFFGLSHDHVLKKKWISIFVYDETMESLLECIGQCPEDTLFFIFCNGARSRGQCQGNIVWMPFLSLEEYGIFQSLCDANIVRGENSLCQGLLSGTPALWDIYKESNGAHLEKIEDYLIFLTKQFPDVDWQRYTQMIRGFNNSTDHKQAFCDFVSGYHIYDDTFWKLSGYIKKECDISQKLEEILISYNYPSE